MAFSGNNNNKINPIMMMKLASRWKKFNEEHPKVVPFFRAVAGSGIQAGSVIEIKVTDPAGQEYVSNIRVTPDDMETVEMLKSMQNDGGGNQ